MFSFRSPLTVEANVNYFILFSEHVLALANAFLLTIYIF